MEGIPTIRGGKSVGHLPMQVLVTILGLLVFAVPSRGRAAEATYDARAHALGKPGAITNQLIETLSTIRPQVNVVMLWGEGPMREDDVKKPPLLQAGDYTLSKVLTRFRPYFRELLPTTSDGIITVTIQCARVADDPFDHRIVKAVNYSGTVMGFVKTCGQLADVPIAAGGGRGVTPRAPVTITLRAGTTLRDALTSLRRSAHLRWSADVWTEAFDAAGRPGGVSHRIVAVDFCPAPTQEEEDQA
jgi:hypothetical protein